MYNKTKFLIVVPMCAMLLSSCTTATQKEGKPNILIVLVDDLGFSDLSCYGSEIPTPNIDSLARNGLKYTQFRNAARCCPSRASLMTGLYPHQAGIGHMMNDLGYDSYRGDLSQNSVTIAEVLKSAGYETYMAGKWHLTRFTDASDPQHNWPLQRGFNKFYGTLPGYGSQFNPAGLMENNDFIEPPADYYYTDALTGKSVDYIREAGDLENPFFLYLAYTAPHYPLHAPEETIKKYRGRFSKGWDSLRLARFKKLENMGLLPAGTRASERGEMNIPWKDEPNKEWQETRMEAYAGMIEHVDQGIGKIIQTLKDTGQLHNTLIFFLSDNGGSAEGHLNNTVERWGTPWKSSLIPNRTRDGKLVTSGDIPGLDPGPETTFGSYGPKWANVSNAPFRLHKSWVHEGGISTPFILHWPNGISDKGALRHQNGHVMDIMATCLDVSEATYPMNFNGNRIKALQGTSLVPSFTNEAIRGTEPLFWEHEGNRAIIKGKWKLVSAYPGSWTSMMEFKNKGDWELYNLKLDRTETNNLAERYPEVVRELSREWQDWADSNGIREYQELGLEKY